MTHREMTCGDRDRYERTLNLPFAKPCYIEELDATSDYLDYWDVVDTMNGRQVFHTTFQVKMWQTGRYKNAIYQSEDWTCRPFLVVTFLQKL